MTWLSFLACGEEPIALVEAEAHALEKLGSACAVVIEVAPMGAATTDHQVRVRDGRVRSLTLRDATCPNAALAELAPMTELIHLDLAGSSVTSLEHVPELDLADLILARTPLSELTHVQRLSPSYLDISQSRVTSLEGLPDSVTVLHARGLGLEKPAGRTFTYIDVGEGTVMALPERDEPPADEARPQLPKVAGTARDTTSVCGSHGGCRGSIGSGSGMLAVEMKGLGKTSARLRVSVGEGTATVWLRDAEGEWAPHPVEGETEVGGLLGTRPVNDAYFYVQGEFRDFAWEVI